MNSEKAFDKIQRPFMIKTLSKLVLVGNFHNLAKTIYKKPIANVILNGEKLKTFSVRSGTSQGYSLSSLLSNIIL